MTPAAHCAIHLDIEPGHLIDGREPVTAIWSRSTYEADYAPVATILTIQGDRPDVLLTPDPMPSWLPRPPAAWLAISEELRDAAEATS